MRRTHVFALGLPTLGCALLVSSAARAAIGASLEHFSGRDVVGTPHNTLVGGELGLKVFPAYHLELRPYGFVGAEVPSNVSTQLAVAPGVLAAYHFGAGFVDVDGRYLATPNPTAFMLLGGAGIAF
jgi:hypothetical protein